MTPDAARERLAAWGRTPDPQFDALDAALALAAADDPASPVAAARTAFDDLSASAARMLAENPPAAGAESAACLRLIASLLASHGYAGDRDNYEDARNANLAHTLVRRRGMPVALGLVWIGLARRLDWPLAGIDFPGHFLLALGGSVGTLLCDPFDGGRILDRAALAQLKTRIAGSDAEPQADDLAVMTDRAVVLRLANNLRVRRLDSGDLEPALSITEDMGRLAPEAPGLMFAAGEVALRLGRPRAALAHLGRFVATDPPADHRRVAEAMLDKARQSLN